jgi:hypothetical protein
VLIEDMLREQNWHRDAPGEGVAALARHRISRIGSDLVFLVVLGAVLAACSADLSLNNVTLAPKPEARKPDWSTQTWGRSNFDRSVPIADLVSPEGQCSPPGPQIANAQSPSPSQENMPPPGGIALQMTECEVVRRAGPVEKIDFGANERGERSVVLTYLRGPSPGIYRFAAGRLVSMERAPSPVPEKPQKATTGAKKPAGT